MLNDHHALGIIDRFAKTIKLIFSKMFIKNNNTKWINKLKQVVTTYNNSKHSSLGGLTPNEAGEEKHFNHIHELNQIKRSYNQTVSD